jgi:hypothetical protein
LAGWLLQTKEEEEEYEEEEAANDLCRVDA